MVVGQLSVHESTKDGEVMTRIQFDVLQREDAKEAELALVHLVEAAVIDIVKSVMGDPDEIKLIGDQHDGGNNR